MNRILRVSAFWFGNTLALAAYAAPPLVPALEEVGFSLDDDWQESLRRVLDRSGRVDPVGPIQQRFAGDHRPETEEALAVSDYALGDEWRWTRAEKGARWWVHSYDALRLGTHVQWKHAGNISEHWQARLRFDRSYTPATQSDLVQGDFVWKPEGEFGPYASVSYYPRIEKQDMDVGLSAGYRHGRYGEARLKLFALDTFSNGSYALAQTRDFAFDENTIVTKQVSLPFAFTLELASERLEGLRLEAYAGAVVPQKREAYTQEFERVRAHEEAAALFGGLAEYHVPTAPLWVGLSGLAFLSRWREVQRSEPSRVLSIHEQTYQSRLYLLAVLDPNLRVESQIRYTARPEQRNEDWAGGTNAQRRDHECMHHTRVEWLFSEHVGFDGAYFRTLRLASGRPAPAVTGRALRVDLRLLLRYEGFLATFGVGINPLPGARGTYAGAGGNMVLLYD